MRNTVILLIATLVLVPMAALFFDKPLTIDQQVVLGQLLTAWALYTGLTFVASTLTRNYSQVDKLWSIMPIGYTWLVAMNGGFTPRLLLMASLITMWGIRLTFNFARKGGYHWPPWKGDEDYRWEVLRQNPMLARPWVWALFNFAFISSYQMGLVLLITLPMLLAIDPVNATIGPIDLIATGLLLIFLAIETIADEQQWRFQKSKATNAEARQKGFIDTGLWSLSRHPNYLGEQAIWAVFYLFSVAATGRWLNWTIAGPLLLMLLFQGSANFSEGISAKKYPGYAEYVKRVPRFIPRIWGKSES
jgi:steroid 5-alpha reductase family enzyme